MHYLDLRVTKAELAREFKISRRTNHHWSETGQLDRELAAGRTQYAPRSRPTHKVDRYRWIIGARLAEFPRLSLQRLFDEVRAAGLRGQLRTGTGPRAERASATAGGGGGALRDTAWGRQGRVDFGTFTLPWGRRCALLVVLGDSSPELPRFRGHNESDAEGEGNDAE